MKHLKMLGLAAAAAAALTALAAPGAAATTLEVGGATKNESIEISMSLEVGTSIVLRDTFGFSSNTCKTSQGLGSTESPYTGSTMTGVGTSMSIGSCERPVTAHDTGVLHISHIAGTTNGTVSSSGAEVTTASPFGTLTCVTGAGTHLGTLTGSATGHATMHVNATLSCSGISSKMIATYTFTSPTGLGISA